MEHLVTVSKEIKRAWENTLGNPSREKESRGDHVKHLIAMVVNPCRGLWIQHPVGNRDDGQEVQQPHPNYGEKAPVFGVGLVHDYLWHGTARAAEDRQKGPHV